MKKILFLVLMLTMAFSQFDNTIAGWYNEHYYVPEGSVYSEGIVVADESSLGSESLAETDFATHAFWTGTNDIDDTGGNAAYTWSANQTSTLTQIQAELATAGVGDRWYVFTYTLAVTTAFDGDGVATITTGFASSAVSLSLVAGTHTVYFKSKTTPVDFVISVVSGSDTEGTWTIDDVTLKEIIGGNIEAYGLFTGGGAKGLDINSVGMAEIGAWGYAGEHVIISESSSNTNAGLGGYFQVDYSATAGKVFAGAYHRLVALTTNQTNQSTMVGSESQFRLRDVDIADGVHAGLWAYAEQSGTSALSGGGTFDAISATVESEAGFSVGATEHITGLTLDSSINAGATINASANFSAIYIKSNGKDWYYGTKYEGIATAEILGTQGETWENISNDGYWKTDGGIIATGETGHAAQQTITLGVGVTTFAVTSNVVQVTGDGGANTVATITDALVGLYTFIFVDGNVTISNDDTHGADSVDLDGANDFTSADDKVLQLIYNGTSWYKVGESTN